MSWVEISTYTDLSDSCLRLSPSRILSVLWTPLVVFLLWRQCFTNNHVPIPFWCDIIGPFQTTLLLVNRLLLHFSSFITLIWSISIANIFWGKPTFPLHKPRPPDIFLFFSYHVQLPPPLSCNIMVWELELFSHLSRDFSLPLFFYSLLPKAGFYFQGCHFHCYILPPNRFFIFPSWPP